MRLSEMKQIVSLLHNEWDLGQKEAKAFGKTCAWIYMFEILAQSESIIIEKSNKKVIGCCGYSKYNSKKHLFRKKVYELIRNILIFSPLVKNRRALDKYNTAYEYTPVEMENKFDGELSILIVKEDFRGKGIGKKMLNDIFEKARQDNIINLKILTDESCNVNVYERLGCTKVFETNLYYGTGIDDFEKGYIYEKNLRFLNK